MMKRIAGKAGGGTDTSRDYEYPDCEDLRAFVEKFAERIVSVTREPHQPQGAQIAS
jgi:menaquinone-dependent protoporphyrinogen oxidase